MRRLIAAQQSALAALVGVLSFGVGYGLPLHIARVIWPASAEGGHMVNDIAGAGAAPLVVRGAWVLALKLAHGGFTAGLRGFARR